MPVCRDPIAAVGIGATGLIGPNGIVNEGRAFTGYRGLDWAAVAAQAGYGRAVRVLNDARAGAWSEYVRTGHYDGAFLHVTAGTRVGCAIIEQGRFLDGADSCAGEFSYQQLIRPGSDRYGNLYRADARLMDGLVDDPPAFGVALTGVIHMTNPNRIVLRGFAPGFVSAVQAHLDRYVFKTHLRTLILEGDEAGVDSDEAAYAAVARYHERSWIAVVRRPPRTRTVKRLIDRWSHTQRPLGDWFPGSHDRMRAGGDRQAR